MKIETVKTSSFTMDFCRFGNGKNTLVILPGLSVQRVLPAADAIAEAYQILTEDFTVFVFERRNDLPAVYSVKDMARDTADALKCLQIGPAFFFGASQGGMIALQIAVEYPDLVKGMVLGSTSAKAVQNNVVADWIQLAKAGEPKALYLAFGKALYPNPVYEQSKGFLIEAATSVTDEDLRRFVVLAEGMNGFDILHDLERICCPVLVIGSEDDLVLGSEPSLQIAERIKNAKLYLYDGYGHAAFDLAPDYKIRMLRFLAPESKQLLSI